MTTMPLRLRGWVQLWIAFEIFIFDRLMTTSLCLCYNLLQLWIAFEIFIFDRLMTTYPVLSSYSLPLWIAFEIFIFDRLMTTWWRLNRSTGCCELLSKFLSLTDWWQHSEYKYVGPYVVNCFRNFYLWQTDDNSCISHSARLKVVNCFRNFYLWQTDDNRPYLLSNKKSVVNCFRNFYLWQTDDNRSVD